MLLLAVIYAVVSCERTQVRWGRFLPNLATSSTYLFDKIISLLRSIQALGPAQISLDSAILPTGVETHIRNIDDRVEARLRHRRNCHGKRHIRFSS